MIAVTMVMSELLYENSRAAATNEETSLRTGVGGLFGCKRFLESRSDEHGWKCWVGMIRSRVIQKDVESQMEMELGTEYGAGQARVMLPAC
jgi:hypothetical protein